MFDPLFDRALRLLSSVMAFGAAGYRSTEVIQASQPLQPLDAAALEQTWPTEDEIPGNGNTAPAVHRRCVRVPKDVGEYERAWLESDTDGADDDGEEEVNMDSDADMQPGEVVSGKLASSCRHALSVWYIAF